MASKREPYEVKTTRTRRVAERFQRKGWELVSENSWLGNAITYTLRRPNPRYRGARG